MEAELLGVETRLSERPAQEANDTTALTREQQSQLDRHKVSPHFQLHLDQSSSGSLSPAPLDCR